ncbi:SDR family oxidoreductase [Pontibacter cellulosilyticus]|uniref:NmrA family NAD(P)-binding protein n=1 Tax=Pontibacter cellulosilyticus TaxID=1720253 RepID=A0A923N325_9BACT|nr:NmrA family NAD(P)-binding protein [Pontibacter cellulosilyticus]MBC5991980.1 NmrA family NAD(P)-binding protein [Pontibacter cellulosilyticus]
MKILVIGGTGTVGSATVKELLARNAEVYVLTRDSEKATNMPEGVETVVGNILDPKTVRSAFTGMDAVFMANPVSTTETSEGLFAVNGARLAGLKKIVYMSIHDYDKALHLPHFGSKLSIEEAIKQSGIPYTFLRPNNFYQNDIWFKDALLHQGVYIQPIGDVGISRVDVRDIAEAAAITLTTTGHEGKAINVVGPKALTGQDTANMWSEALGIPVSYFGNDMDAWENMMVQFMPDWMVFDFRLMFEHFQKVGLKATPEDLEKLTALLGHAPRSFGDYTREAAAQWAVTPDSVVAES